ncbi:hypothetical protein FB565_003018 [Actinoplanes lutulentus]|uniref:Helix-hairpin-helix protein n=1 Tax=Actinoplanes lutulentus TaxID=1287878 RepID=A0A327Z1U9_9ACTN|nr:helix-hairpin-helix domain-containing protein [Actinoplanes lutulentus]MBB2943305.1 hypothetical protein [Actinoplanes lutulentus]RAK28364.1 helix-hairpin-helix protein [Actinoplanes lutulentus]
MTWSAFLYIGVRARKAYWIGVGAVYLLATVAYFVLIETTKNEEGKSSEWVGGLAAAIWIAGMVHAILVNRSWLRWLAVNNSPWYVRPLQSMPVHAPLPDQIHDMGVGQQQFYGSSHPTAPPPTAVSLDVARASAEQLSVLPGFDLARGRRVVAERSSQGGFRTVEDFIAAASLAPHEYVRIRGLVTCSPPEQKPGGNTTDRILDF